MNTFCDAQCNITLPDSLFFLQCRITQYHTTLYNVPSPCVCESTKSAYIRTPVSDHMHVCAGGLHSLISITALGQLINTPWKVRH